MHAKNQKATWVFMISKSARSDRSARSGRITYCEKLKYTCIFQKTTGFWKTTFYELFKCALRYFGERKPIFGPGLKDDKFHLNVMRGWTLNSKQSVVQIEKLKFNLSVAKH